MNFVKKCVLKTSEACEFKPQEGKWVYVNYGSQICQPGEYLQPMLLNTIVERNLVNPNFLREQGTKKVQPYIL